MNGIYGYLDLKTNDIVYIGKDSHIDKDKRHKAHLSKSRYNNQPFNRVLQNNPKRYKYARIIVGDFYNIMLNGLEIQYIEACNPKFNFTLGGDGMIGYTPSKKTREKMSKAHKGKIFSQEHRQRLSISKKGENNPMFGKTLSKETKEKLSKANKGENNSFYGKTHSQETKEKMSKARNTLGIFRVCKRQANDCKQGFRWVYSYKKNSKSKSISSVDLLKLKSKVLAKGLPWKIIDEEKAKKTFIEGGDTQWQT